MSIRVLVTIQAAPGKSDELHKKFAEILGDTRAFDGCESIELVRDQQDDHVLILIESWRDLAAYQAYKKWRKDSGTSVAGGPLVTKAQPVICDPLEA